MKFMTTVLLVAALCGGVHAQLLPTPPEPVAPPVPLRPRWQVDQPPPPPARRKFDPWVDTYPGFRSVPGRDYGAREGERQEACVVERALNRYIPKCHGE